MKTSKPVKRLVSATFLGFHVKVSGSNTNRFVYSRRRSRWDDVKTVFVCPETFGLISNFLIKVYRCFMPSLVTIFVWLVHVSALMLMRIFQNLCSQITHNTKWLDSNSKLYSYSVCISSYSKSTIFQLPHQRKKNLKGPL